MYSSTLSLTSAPDGMGGKHNAPTALTPGKSRYSLYRVLGGPQGRSERVRKIMPRPHRDSISGPSSRLQVAIPTELSRPTLVIHVNINILAPELFF